MNKYQFPQLFQFSLYKKYLKEFIQLNKKVRGLIRILSDAAHCQPSYLSQVLTTKVQLTQEHGFHLAIFFNFSPDEQDYFLQLISYERSAHPSLSKYYLSKIEKIQNQHQNVSKNIYRLSIKSKEELTKYYSHWSYCYVHLLTSIEKFQYFENLLENTNLKKDALLEVLNYLESMGLVLKQHNKWVHSGEEFHMDKSNPLSVLHHNNWRQQAVVSAQRASVNNIHYTSVYTLSKDDAEKLKLMQLEFIKQMDRLVVNSKEENALIYCCDVFSMD